MNIKEIALKVASELDFSGPIAISPLPDHLYIDFAEALIAELAKQNEPIGAIQNGKFQWNTDGGPEKWRARKDFSGKLYTLPPTAEQIANETAEAIAEYCRNQDHYCLATEIENGAWKDFKK